MAEIPTSVLDAAAEMLGEQGHRGRFPIVGQSMLPGLHPGDEVCVEFAPSDLSQGALVLFRQRDYLVVHRLLGRRGEALRTRGDALQTLDPWVTAERVVGRAVALRRGERWWSLEGPGAALYARAMAWHCCAWWGASVVASWPQRAAKKVGIPLPLTAIVAFGDRTMARLAYALAFRALHRRLEEVPESRCYT